MVQSIEDYSFQGISDRMNLRRGEASFLYIRFPVFFFCWAMHHVSIYFLGKTVFRFLPDEKRSCSLKKNTIFPDNIRKITCQHGPFWKDHLFGGPEENIRFPCIFLERSFFILCQRCKIIFSGKGYITFPDNTRKIMFQRNFSRKTIFVGRPEKKMVFRAV